MVSHEAGGATARSTETTSVQRCDVHTDVAETHRPCFLTPSIVRGPCAMTRAGVPRTMSGGIPSQLQCTCFHAHARLGAVQVSERLVLLGLYWELSAGFKKIVTNALMSTESGKNPDSVGVSLSSGEVSRIQDVSTVLDGRCESLTHVWSTSNGLTFVLTRITGETVIYAGPRAGSFHVSSVQKRQRHRAYWRPRRM